MTSRLETVKILQCSHHTMTRGEVGRNTVRRHKKILPLPTSSYTVLTFVVRTGEEQSHHCDSISKTRGNFLPDFVKKFFFLFEICSSFFLPIRDKIFQNFFLKIMNPGSRILARQLNKVVFVFQVKTALGYKISKKVYYTPKIFVHSKFFVQTFCLNF